MRQQKRGVSILIQIMLVETAPQRTSSIDCGNAVPDGLEYIQVCLSQHLTFLGLACSTDPDWGAHEIRESARGRDALEKFSNTMPAGTRFSVSSLSSDFNLLADGLT